MFKFKKLLHAIFRRNLFIKEIRSTKTTIIEKENVVDFVDAKTRKEREEEFSRLCREIVIEEHIIDQLEGKMHVNAHAALMVRKESVMAKFPEYFPLKTEANALENLKIAGNIKS